MEIPVQSPADDLNRAAKGITHHGNRAHISHSWVIQGTHDVNAGKLRALSQYQFVVESTPLSTSKNSWTGTPLQSDKLKTVFESASFLISTP